MRKNYIITLLILFIFSLNSCASLPGGDAKNNPPDPKQRVKKNLEEGKGFRLSNSIGKKSTTFDFATSNELWRASLDTIDFMPLSSVNYSGGMIITDWYSSKNNTDESIKISIRFLTNEIRADALDIKVFNKKCDEQNRCFISKNETKLISELKKKILKKAAIYNTMKEEKLKKERKKNPYIISTPGDR